MLQSVAFGIGSPHILNVSNAFARWVEAAEQTILGHHDLGGRARSRSAGCSLKVTVVKQAEYTRQQPLKGGISSWRARVHN
eukprot:6157778-Pyramimonas_sp.AAC.1